MVDVLELVHDRALVVNSEEFLHNVDWLVLVGGPLRHVLRILSNGGFVDVDLSSESVELAQPGFANDVSTHGSFEGVVSELGVLLLVLEGADGSLHREHHVLCGVGFEGEPSSFFAFPLELKHGVLKPTSFEGDDWSGSDEELVLDNTTWLESGWHQTEVRASVDKCTISEEFLWRSPEACWVLAPQIPHLVGTSSRVWVLHVGWSADDELDFTIELFDDSLSDVYNEVNTLLSSNSTNEAEKWSLIIKLVQAEVLLLKHPLSSNVIWCSHIKLSDSLGDWDTIWESKWLWFLSQKISQTILSQNFVSVTQRHGSPLVREHHSASTWIDDIAFRVAH